MNNDNSNPQTQTDWRSSLSHIDMGQEEVRRTIADAVGNMEVLLDKYQTELAPREIAGIEKSMGELMTLLGAQPPDRRFHDDGCSINKDDEEAGGHDFADGCELEEVED